MGNAKNRFYHGLTLFCFSGLSGVLVQVNQCGFAHSLAIKVHDKAISSVSVETHLNGLPPKVNGGGIHTSLS